MNFSFVYIAQRAVYRLGDFFHHWYVDGSRRLIHDLVARLEELDKSFAFKVTIQHFFEPLYKDYSIIGRILGVLFRSGRVAVGGFAYAVFSIIFLAIYLIWISIPIALVVYAILNL